MRSTSRASQNAGPALENPSLLTTTTTPPSPAYRLSCLAHRYAVAVVLFLTACAIAYGLRTTANVGLILVPSFGPFASGRGRGGDVVGNTPTPPNQDDIDLVDSEDVRLERVLKEAAMVDKTVILTNLNAAWARPGSLLDLFLESFRVGNQTRRLLDHLVIVAMDHEAYGFCKAVHPHCFALTTEGVDFSGQKNYMTDGFLKMMWRRIDFMRTVLEKGYNFIFTDTDIMWFRDPFPNFYKDGDFQISSDRYRGNSFDLRNSPNAGFMYVKSSNQSIAFYKFWYSSRLKYPRKNEQDVLHFIKGNPFLHKIGIQIRFLDTVYFGGLCEPSKDLNKVCTMHTNCCIGLSRKLNDLRAMIEDWKYFMSQPSSTKNSRSAFWSVPQKCSFDPITDA